MRITSVDLYSSKDVLIATLSFRDPTAQNPYMVKAIVGIDADEIISRFYGMSKKSRQKYYHLSVESRDVVLRIALNPNFSTQTYSELRDELYKMIAASRTGRVDIRFNDGTTAIAHLTGFIKKFEASHFAEQPEVQITVQCDDPSIKGLTRVHPIAEPSTQSAATITDDFSTAPHGFQFNLTFNNTALDFILRDSTDPEWVFTVTPGIINAETGFLVGDILYFSSEYGDKFLYMNRRGTIIHLVDKIKNDSIWPIMFPGENYFDSANADITWNDVSYFPAYWGI